MTSGKAALVGTLPPDQTMSASIVLPLRNQTELTSLLARLYDPSSPDFRHFLSVAQFTEQFGPSADDFQAVVAYAQAHGLTVTATPANRLVVPVTGSVAQIDQAFGVTLNVYQHPTANRTFFSPDREPSLDLAVPVAHVAGLNNFAPPRPLVTRPQGAQPTPNVTGSGPGGAYLASDMRAAYYGGTTLTGNGQTVGLLEFTGYDVNDVNATFANAGQAYTVPLQNVLLDGATGTGTDASGEAEVVLDIVQAIGMAPGLNQVRVYIGNGNDDPNLLNTMASENLAKVLSCSWGWMPEDPGVDDPFFQEFAAQGQGFLTASGDSGAFDSAVDPYFYPQEDAYVTAVGGTHLLTAGAGGSWSSETAWNTGGGGSGGGISPDNIGLPSWQAGLANATNGGSASLRNVPDVAMEGDFDNYVCSIGRCYGDYAGTSFAAPRWAGFLALVNEQAVEAGTVPQGGVGFVNPALYRLAQAAASAADFHDITVGNNHTANQPVWFSAVAGYDLVTGWGSANGQALINDLAGPQVPGFWIQAASPSLSLDQGASVTDTLTVTEAGGFTGDVTLTIPTALPSGITATWSANPTHSTSVLTLTATSSAAPSTTTLTVTGTSGSLSASTDVTVAVHAPTFALSATPEPVAVNQGSSSATTVQVTPEYGFTGNVTLSVSGLPTGVTATLGTNPTAGSSVLTFSAGNAAVAGTSPITVTGTAGSLTVTHTFNLSVHAPSFTLSVPGLDVGQGSTASTYLIVSPMYGFNGAVNLAVTGLPAGVTASFSPNPSTNQSILTVTASSAAAVGSSTLTVTGTSGSLSATTTLTLGVHMPSFTLSSPGTLNIGQGGTGTSSMYVNPRYGFTGSVTFSIAGLPSGVTALWNPNPSSGNTQLSLSATGAAPVGQYTLTITGTSGSLSATTTLTLGVYVPTFTLYGNGANVGQGGSANGSVSISPEYGFTGSVALTAIGLPSGVTATFSPNPTTGYSNVTFAAVSTAAVGQYTITVSGTSGGQSKTTTMTLGVYVPTFTLSSNYSVNLGKGTSSTLYIYVNPQYGFAGSVNLAISGLPSGVSASFSPNPTTGSSIVTLTASPTASLGQYTATITGSSGSQTASRMLSVGVYVPTFTLSSGGAVSVGQGSTASTYLYVNPQYGFGGNVTLAVSGLPAGVTAAFSPNPTTGYTSLTLTASSTASLGQYTATITGTSGSQTASTPLSVGVFAPSFTLSTYSQVNIGQGSSGTAYVFSNSSYGFNGSINLAVSGLPGGVTAAFSPNPSTGTSTLTVAAGSTAALGQYTLTITGTSGTLTAATTLTLGIYAPTFGLNSYSSTLTLNQGGSGTANFSVSPQYGFNSPVMLTATGLPSGVTAAFSPNPVTNTSTLTLTASSSATPGPATVTITGSAGSATATTSLALTVNASSFALTLAPATANLLPGTSATSTVAIVPQNGFTGSVNLAVSGLPAGITGAFSVNPTTGTSFLQLTASASAVAGTTTATVTGTSGALTASVPLTVVVRAALPVTLTQLAITAAGSPATSVSSGTVVTLTATVTAGGSAALTNGQVQFCDASASTCDATHLLGTAQLTGAGVATLRFIPGPGSHSLKANFVGTSTEGGSSSASAALGVSAAQATTTTLRETGTPGSYTLTATVVGQGLTAPSGTVSFLDTSNGNAALGDAPLGRSQTALSFGSAHAIATGPAPTSVVVADLNNDGKADVAVASANNNSLSILLGNGDGTFTAAGQTMATGNQPSTVVSADFNADGNPDLAVLNSDSNSVSFFLGNGDGTFTASSLSPQTGSYPKGMALGDFNGDGRPDLAIVNQGSASVTVLLSNGDGTFTAAALTAQTGSYPDAIATADFNNDGILDLAVANHFGGTVTILLGNGDGSFSTGATVPAGSNPGFLAVADFNKDGFPDLAVAGDSSSSLTVLLGKGDGTFAAAPSPPSPPYSPASLVVADMNADGVPDLALVFGFANQIYVLLGNGDGTFAADATLSTPARPTYLVTGDFTGDGVTDFLITNYAANSLSEFTGQFTQTATATVSGIAPTTGGPHATKAAYAGNGTYAPSASTTVALSAPPITPTVAVQVSAASITTAQALTVTITISPNGSIAATGSVALTGGGYTSPGTPVTGGAATLTVPAGSLAVGTDALTVTFTPDTAGTVNFTGATGAGSVVVTAQPKVTPTVSLTPSARSLTTGQPLTVTIGVGAGGSNPVATGTVVLTGGGYTSAASPLANGVVTIAVPAGSLAVGTNTLTASYTPDTAGASAFYPAVGSSSVVVTPKIMPSVAVAPSSASITTAQALPVTVTVAGANGSPAPTGSVTLTSGSYTSAPTVLTAGAANFTIPAGSLAIGADTLLVSFTPDAASAPIDNSASGSAPVAVTAPPKVTPGVTVTPSAASLTTAQPLTVTVAVAAGAGAQPPTGTVTLSTGGYNSQQPLASGTATFNLPAGTLPTGSDPLTATYTPDAASAATYNPGTGAATVTVTPAPAAMTLTASSAPSAAAGAATSATLSLAASSTYSGTVSLSCALTASPAGAQGLPTCSVAPATVQLTGGGSATATLTVSTTAPSVSLNHPGTLQKTWRLGFGSAALAGMVCFWLPGRGRRRWPALLPMLLVALLTLGVAGCAGKPSPSSPTQPSTPGTTEGQYTFTVTGTDTTNPKVIALTTVLVTVHN